MARPREHDIDGLLDQARAVWAANGLSGLTIRALSAATGASNGAIYNAFGSRDNLVARVWTREADGFLDHQRREVDRALAAHGPQEAVVVAALALSHHAETRPDAARVLLGTHVSELLATDVDEDLERDLRRLRSQLGELVVELSRSLWGREDRTATTLVTRCLVDLPSALLLAKGRVTDPLARHALRCAVQGIAGAEPPAYETRRS